MAAHSPQGPAIVNVLADQPASGYPEWFREMARAINALSVAVQELRDGTTALNTRIATLETMRAESAERPPPG